MTYQHQESLAIIKRAAARRQKQAAASLAVERDMAKWLYKLRFNLVGLIAAYVMTVIGLFVLIVPPLIPDDLQAFGYVALAALPLNFMFYFGAVLEGWVKDRTDWYWFWRITTVTLWLVTGGALLYGMYASAPTWLPHFR